jgi:lipoprotein-anchoring transpeptidase ErfK/SrfK
LITRRDFLKTGGIALAAVAVPPAKWIIPRGLLSSVGMLGRVTQRSVSVYEKPSFDSLKVRKVPRDTLLSLLEEVYAPSGPGYSSHWYRLDVGFVHSAHIQRVEKAHLSEPISQVPPAGQLGEVTVPYTNTTYKTRRGTEMSLYRLYYQSVHWITGIEESAEGIPMYTLFDERLKVRYKIPARHMRPVTNEEISPLSPGIQPGQKRIIVSIARQQLAAFEGDKPVLQAPISSGRKYMETRPGNFQVDRKCPTKHMGDGGLTADINAYELVGVPWVSFFQNPGIAFHGTFWHDNFGFPMSQGCVNMRNEDAKWLFRWCSPVFNPEVKERKDWVATGEGTSVFVF